jgi:hypothetical protein
MHMQSLYRLSKRFHMTTKNIAIGSSSHIDR